MTTNGNHLGDLDTARRKAILEGMQAELAIPLSERDEVRVEYLADPLDQVKSNTDRDMAVQRLDQRARLAHEVRLALARIREGDYGICERCERPIPARRLDAIPWARLCVPCQSELELLGAAETSDFESAA